MNDTLSITELKPAKNTLEVVFSEDMKEVPLQGKHLMANIFSPEKEQPTELHLPSEPTKKGSSLIFKLDKELKTGDLLVVHIKPMSEGEMRNILQHAKVEKLDFTFISTTVLEVAAALASFRDLLGDGSPEELSDGPEPVIWRKAIQTAEDLRAHHKANPNLDYVIEHLREAKECEEERYALLESVTERIFWIREEIDSSKVEILFSAVWWLKTIYCKQDLLRSQILRLMSVLSVAMANFLDFQGQAEKQTDSKSFIPLCGVRPNGHLVSGITHNLNTQSTTLASLLMELEMCAERVVVLEKRQKLMELQTKVEELCCSLVCEFQTFRYSYRADQSEKLVMNLAGAVRYIAQARAIIENLTFDPLGPWNRFNAHVMKMQQFGAQLSKQITTPNLDIDLKILVKAQTSLATIQDGIESMVGQSQGLQQISASSGTLVAQYRQWAAQVQQQIDKLLFIEVLHKCGFKAALLEMSTITVQIYCFLTYVEHEYKVYAEKQKKLAAEPSAPALPPPKVLIGQPLGSNTGVIFGLSGLTRMFTPRVNGYLQLTNLSTGKPIQVVPASASMTSVAVIAAAGTVIELQAYADGELVATAVSTASAPTPATAPAPAIAAAPAAASTVAAEAAPTAPPAASAVPAAALPAFSKTQPGVPKVAPAEAPPIARAAHAG